MRRIHGVPRAESGARISSPAHALPPWRFERATGVRRLCTQFGTRDLAAFGADDAPLAVAAAGALLDYAQATQQAALVHVRTLTVERAIGVSSRASDAASSTNGLPDATAVKR